MHVIQKSLLSYEHFLAEGDDNHRLVKVLDSLDADVLIAKLNRERNRRIPILGTTGCFGTH